MKLDKNSLISINLIATMAVLFGALAIYLGYDSVIIGAVFGFLGTIAGYIYGREEETKEETKETC